jgi:hypothetical protein
MTQEDLKAVLHSNLRSARETMLWKLDGVSEYDVRRPLVPTGTNLLGLVKHLACVELGYFGETFGRPHGESVPDGETDPTADLYATADESRAQIADLYRRAWVHADATIDGLTLDAPGRVPHWPADRAEVTLHRIMVHVLAETNRHAGHADIVRELIDGAVGHRRDNDNLASPIPRHWGNTGSSSSGSPGSFPAPADPGRYRALCAPRPRQLSGRRVLQYANRVTDRPARPNSRNTQPLLLLGWGEGGCGG